MPPPQLSKISGTDSLPIAADTMPMVLGMQLNNPYSVTNMLATYDSLDNAGFTSENSFSVRLTHKYIKYYPANAEDFEDLVADTNLNFYDYPLDYQVLVQGNFYHDPSIADSLPTPQYVVVPNGYSYNTTVAHEVLDELYIPEEDPQLLGLGLDENLEYGNSLLEGAFHHAGTHLEPATPWGDSPGSWHGVPLRNGTIRVFDNRLGQYIPLEGVQVKATRWFTTRKGITNTSGTYSLDGNPFRRSADYSIHFNDPHNNRFSIRNRHNQVPAKIVRNNIGGNSWSYDIPDGTDRMHATMHRASYRYYYGNVAGLRRPIRSGMRPQLLVSKQRRNGGAMNWIVFPTIVVAERADGMSGRVYDTDELFSTTIHELAHTAHVLSMNNVLDYANVSALVQESWAVGVEWLITRMEYQERGIANYMEWDYNPTTAYNVVFPIRHGYQYWNRTNSSDEYTSLFINLVDGFNELNQIFPNRPTGVVNDQVTSYSLATIQNNYLNSIYGASSLFNQLNNNRPSSISTAQLNLLLSFY